MKKGLQSIFSDVDAEGSTGDIEVEQDGVRVEVSCPHCASFDEITIGWSEMAAMAQRKLPSGEARSQNGDILVFVQTQSGYQVGFVCPRCEQDFRRNGKSCTPQKGMPQLAFEAAAARRREITAYRNLDQGMIARMARLGGRGR